MTAPSPLVAQISPFYPPHLGGVENVTRSLARTLARRREVLVLTTSCGAPGAPRVEHEPRLTVDRAPGLELAHTPLSPGLVARLLALPRDAVVHAHVAHAFLPEVVWATSRLRRRPYIIHFHLDVDPSGRLGRLLPFYKRHVFARALRGATRVIALSPEQAVFLTERYGIPDERVVVVPNGVDQEFFLPARPSRPVSTTAPLRVLFVGRLDAQKNVGRLLDAMALVAEPIELVVVGDGEQRDDLKARAAGGGANVRLVGAQRGEALVEWYRWAEAFVLPSDKEGMPLVLLEAMAASLPVVATDVPGTRELLDGVGLLTAPTPAGIAAGLDGVARDPAWRAEMATLSATRARALSWDVLATRIEDVYAAL